MPFTGVWGERADVCDPSLCDPSLGELAVRGTLRAGKPCRALGCVEGVSTCNLWEENWKWKCFILGRNEEGRTGSSGEIQLFWQCEGMLMLCYRWPLRSLCGSWWHWRWMLRGRSPPCCSGVLPALCRGLLLPPGQHFWESAGTAPSPVGLRRGKLWQKSQCHWFWAAVAQCQIHPSWL